MVLDALTYAGNKNNLVDLLGQDWFEFVHGSICDQELVESLLHKHEIDTLVHFAAESHVDRSITGPRCLYRHEYCRHPQPVEGRQEILDR